MKLLEIVNAIPALTKLAAADMPLPDAYRLQKLIASLQADIDFFNAQKLKTAQKYGVVRDDNFVDIPGDKIAEAQSELDELLNMNVETEITAIQIPANDSIKLSANDIGLLAPFAEFIFETEE
ncbi:hypothetical protein FACS1894219_11810 [Clostridia bacterium]|nr:hypothetical protein FACS1894219_11810 [Clostridia bacterium]